MDYSKIVAVSGLPGLYELINSKTDGAIVRSLEDNNTRFASSRIHNFSHLESIEIFTIGDNVNLVEIFYAMDKAGDLLPDAKDNDAVKKYFEKTYPEIDFERVYASDLKKIIKWYEVLKNKNVEIKLSEPPVEPEPESAEEVAKEVKETGNEKPAKKPAAPAEKKMPKKEPVKKAAPAKPAGAKKAKEEKEKEDKPAAKKTATKKAATKKAAPEKKAAKKK